MILRISEARKRGMPPVRLIALSFAIIILVGAFLLTLPISSKDGNFTHPLDALFTSTSATCVTGLVVFDTFTKWTWFGQGVILMLIQLGGLGLVTFTSFFAFTIRRRAGIKELQLANEYISNGNLADVPQLFRLICIVTFAFETVGAVLLGIRFVPKYGLQGIWTSIFLSVSAYCNAGFDILGMEGPFSNLIHYNDDPLVILVIAFLIIFGGLGFVVINDIVFMRKHGHVLLHTRIVLLCTAALILVGTIGILSIEYNNPDTLGPMPFGEKLSASFFQSVSARTAGFNSIDLASMREPGKLLMCALMFIGAAPGSTGGGIKVTTFVVLIMTVYSVMRGRDDTVVLHRRVDKKVVYKALAITILSATLVIVTFFVIFYCQRQLGVSSIDSLFESVSAFGTVGLSCSVTPGLAAGAKIAVIFTMFCGRVGPVSLALAISANSKKNDAILPEGRIMVG